MSSSPRTGTPAGRSTATPPFTSARHGPVYAGGGIAFAHPGGGETKTGYNLFAGLNAAADLRAAPRPFLEARWTFVNDTSPFRLVFGFNYQLGD